MLSEKIQKLEHLCSLKDKRIEDMTERLERQKEAARKPARGAVLRGAQQQGYYRPQQQQQQPRWN